MLADHWLVKQLKLYLIKSAPNYGHDEKLRSEPAAAVF
jgi:hypothetical protein